MFPAGAQTRLDEHVFVSSIRHADQDLVVNRGSLEEMLTAGLSLEEIGRRFDRHPSTIGYWVRKHGLVAPLRDRHAPKGALRKEQLEALVEEGLPLSAIAEQVGRSYSTVRYWTKRYGLETAHLRRLRSGDKPAELERVCPRHGLTLFVLETRGSYRCRRCRAEAVSRRRRKVKATLIAEAGGACQLCGYDRYQGALEFHHRDPAEKSFGFAWGGVSRSLEAMRQEARKCVLLCANCHAEVEGGVAALASPTEADDSPADNLEGHHSRVAQLAARATVNR
jgi:transposase